MKTIKLEDYATNKVDKVDLVGTGISIKQHQFIKDNGINLSAMVRDVLEKLMNDKETSSNEQTKTA